MSGFGGPPNTGAPGFSFGSTGTAPTFGTAPNAFGATQTGAAFGAAQQSAFGAPQTGAAPAFGTPQTGAAPAFGALQTGASSAFGATQLGAAPAFGASQTGGFNAGTITTSKAGGGALGFGQTQTTSAFGSVGIASTGGGLGAGGGAFNFSSPAATTTAAAAPTSAPGGFGGFGTQPKTTAATTGFNFGASTSAGAFNLSGAAASTAAQTQAGFNFAKPTTAANLGNFGAIAAPATAGFGALGGSGSLFGKTTADMTNQSIFGTSIAPAAAPSLGLGGTDLNASQPKSNEGKPDNVKVKETQVPEQILRTVDALKNYIKEQKACSSEIARASSRKLSTVSSEIQSLNWSLQEIANNVESNYSKIKLLRGDTSRAIQCAEMAQRTQETSMGLQFENVAPFQFFQELVHKYESDLINFRTQVELTEKHMRSLTNPQQFTADDLKRGLQQIHESFVALAGRLQELHTKVESQKEQYLNLRKYLLRDTNNIFADIETDETKATAGKISSGPTPFSALAGLQLGKTTAITNQAMAPWQTSITQPTTGNLLGAAAFGGTQSAGTSAFGSSGTGFGAGAFGGAASSTSWGVAASAAPGSDSFNLQKPPFGSKRNKQYRLR